MRRRDPELGVTMRSGGLGPLSLSRGQGRSGASLAIAGARRQVWAKLALRALALGLAALGLAGIGGVVAHAPPAEGGRSSAAGVGLGALTERLAALGAAPAAPLPVVARHPPSGPLSPGPPPVASGGASASVSHVAPPSECVPCACPAPSAPPSRPARPRATVAGPPPAAPAAALAPELAQPAAGAPEGRLPLNRATVSELMRLPGIGAKRAQAIVELRQRLGRFRQPSDLLRVKGIGPRTLERLLPQVSVE